MPQRRLWGFVAAATAIGVVIGALWYGFGPPRTSQSYTAEAVKAAESLESQVTTAGLWVTAVANRRVTAQSASVAFVESETDASNTISRFQAFNPPAPSLIALREQVISSGNAAVGVLGRLRVAARAGDWQRVRDAGPQLERVRSELSGLQESAA